VAQLVRCVDGRITASIKTSCMLAAIAWQQRRGWQRAASIGDGGGGGFDHARLSSSSQGRRTRAAGPGRQGDRTIGRHMWKAGPAKQMIRRRCDAPPRPSANGVIAACERQISVPLQSRRLGTAEDNDRPPRHSNSSCRRPWIR
jgi:hypothetical protein